MRRRRAATQRLATPRAACCAALASHDINHTCLSTLSSRSQAELARLRGPGERLARVAVYARIFAAELLGTVLAVPFGWRALALHLSLPDARRRGGGGAGAAADTVSILRDVR